MKTHAHACYLLRRRGKKNTYIGYTHNFEHRLRQHRMKIKGGAKATRAWKGAVDVMGIIWGFKDPCAALQFEWAWKHQGKEGRTTKTPSKTDTGRIDRIYQLLTQPMWTKQGRARGPLTLAWIKGIPWQTPSSKLKFHVPVRVYETTEAQLMIDLSHERSITSPGGT